MRIVPLSIVLIMALSLAVTSTAAGQALYGHDGLQRMPESVQHTWMSQLPVRVLLTDAHFGQSTIRTTHTSGSYRTLQDPETSLHTRLQSYGITSFGRLRLEGTFTFQQEQDDQIGWKLGRDVVNQPYYLANIRAGDWDNDRYSVFVNGGSRFFNDRLLLAFGVDYEVERLARYNDPRPLINYHNLFLKAQVGLQLNNHLVALYGGNGTAKENGIVRNYNISNDSFGRTEYNLITVTGLGSYSLLRRSQYEHPTEQWQSGLTYQWHRHHTTLSAEFVYANRESDFIRRGTSGGGAIFEHMGSFSEDQVNFNLYFSTPLGKNVVQLISRTQVNDAYDINTQFNGANFFHTGIDQQLHLLFHNRAETLSLLLNGAFSDFSVNDRNASHAIDISRASAGIAAQISRSMGSWRAAFIPGIGYETLLNSDLRVPADRENLYTQHILYPYYFIETADLLSIKAGLQLQRYLNDLSVALLVTAQSDRRINDGISHTTSVFTPGTHRNSLSVTLQFFH